ncbi:Structural maintenance of chromosomes protein 6A, partial [Trichoplax sp. H2]
NPVGKGEQPTTMVHCVHVVVDLLDGDVIAKTTRSTHTKCRQQCYQPPTNNYDATFLHHQHCPMCQSSSPPTSLRTPSQSIESNNSQSDDQKTSGIILQIQLINFMCHSNLTVTLGENVNFVIGRNGSGKSAIMTGIIICLGGRSSVTNRASSLKEFIKKGS